MGSWHDNKINKWEIISRRKKKILSLNPFRRNIFSSPIKFSFTRPPTNPALSTKSPHFQNNSPQLFRETSKNITTTNAIQSVISGNIMNSITQDTAQISKNSISSSMGALLLTSKKSFLIAAINRCLSLPRKSKLYYLAFYAASDSIMGFLRANKSV